MAQHIMTGGSEVYKKFDTAFWQYEMVIKMMSTPITTLLIASYFQVNEKFDCRCPMYDSAR
jgi:hypothetical protein